MNDRSHQAARWFTRLLDLPADHPERLAFARWLAEDPRNTTEYQSFSELWSDFSSTGQTHTLAGAMERVGRRRFMRGGLLGLLLMGSAAGWLTWRQRYGVQQRYFTGIAEQQRLALDDGSQVLLDADSRLHVRYNASTRQLYLLRGRAIFDVRRDTGRPFTVDAGLAQITVLGTRFVVERFADQVQVSVEHGQVRLSNEHTALLLGTGQVGRCTANGELQRLSRSAAAAFSFAEGSLSFEAASLSEVAAVLSRYRRQPLQVKGQPAQRLNAVVRLNDIETFVQALPELAQVQLQTRDGVTWLVPR
ncbi:hypothetical protein PS3A_56500 [Pseudomonas sp. 3A(2025)]